MMWLAIAVAVGVVIGIGCAFLYVLNLLLNGRGLGP
jgi:hypothetical protein